MNSSTAPFQQAGIIDIGAHSIRLEIYQFAPDGAMEILEKAGRAVNLGFDVFRHGVIAPANINLVCEIMRDFAGRLREYGVTVFRAVATSAVREAGNRELLLDRVKLACGITIEILESQEEARLLYAGMRRELERGNSFPDGQLFCFALGTGSLIVLFAHRKLLRFSETIALGSVRMFDEYGKVEMQPERILDLLESQEIRARLIRSASYDPAQPCTVVGMGAGVRALLKLAGRAMMPSGMAALGLETVAELTDHVMRESPLKLTSEYGLADHLAVSVAPSCGVADYFLRAFGADSLVIPAVTTRLALLDEMRRPAARDEFEPDLLAVVRAIGEKYGYDARHAELTAEAALKIFDKLKHRYALSGRDRLVLEVASLLHDAGRFIDLRRHHRHSGYIIAHSQLPGLTELELKLAATVARYHRGAPPKLTHPEFAAFHADDRVRVAKLAAILRVADALIRGDSDKYRRIEVHLSASALTLVTAGGADWLWETVHLAKKGDMFREVFGLPIKFEETLDRTCP